MVILNKVNKEFKIGQLVIVDLKLNRIGIGRIVEQVQKNINRGNTYKIKVFLVSRNGRYDNKPKNGIFTVYRKSWNIYKYLSISTRNQPSEDLSKHYRLLCALEEIDNKYK